MIYISSPYWHEREDIRDRRVAMAAMFAAACIDRKIPVFAPLSHAHGLIRESVWLSPPSEKIWLEIAVRMLPGMDGLAVLRLPGHDKSTGVTVERAHMLAIGKPVWVSPHIPAIPDLSWADTIADECLDWFRELDILELGQLQ